PCHPLGARKPHHRLRRRNRRTLKPSPGLTNRRIRGGIPNHWLCAPNTDATPSNAEAKNKPAMPRPLNTRVTISRIQQISLGRTPCADTSSAQRVERRRGSLSGRSAPWAPIIGGPCHGSATPQL